MVFFRPLIRTLHTRFHRLRRALELCAEIQCFFTPEPTPFVELALKEHHWPREDPFPSLLNSAEDIIHENSVI